MELAYEFGEDFKTAFKEAVDELVAEGPDLTRTQRIDRVAQLTDAYVIQTGERPDTSQLHRLADVILREELSDPHPDRITRNEYPIMSDRMLGRRTTGAERRRKQDGTVTVEVPFEHASNVATDGRDYTQPIRNFKNPFI